MSFGNRENVVSETTEPLGKRRAVMHDVEKRGRIGYVAVFAVTVVVAVVVGWVLAVAVGAAVAVVVAAAVAVGVITGCDVGFTATLVVVVVVVVVVAVVGAVTVLTGRGATNLGVSGPPGMLAPPPPPGRQNFVAPLSEMLMQSL